jgi:hypothetical protein
VFSNSGNHTTEAFSILATLAKRESFNPRSQPERSLEQELDEIVRETTECSFFVDSNSKILEDLLFLDGSLTQFEDAIRRSPAVAKDNELIALNLRNFIPGSFDSREPKDRILHLLVLEKPRDCDRVWLRYVRVSLTLDMDNKGQVFIPRQLATMFCILPIAYRNRAAGKRNIKEEWVDEEDGEQ